MPSVCKLDLPVAVSSIDAHVGALVKSSNLVVCNTVGMEVKLPGQPCGAGLTTTAADDLGLKAGLPVAVSSIDAHAGTLGNSVHLLFHQGWWSYVISCLSVCLSVCDSVNR